MYDNIGEKIKNSAKWICIVESISAVIGGIFVIIDDFDSFFKGLLLIVLGPVVAYVSTWLLYGFGQLIENSDIIAQEYRRTNEKHEKAVAKNAERKQSQKRQNIKATIANPNVKEDEYIDMNCPYCQAEISYTKGELLNGKELICPMCDAPISI